MTYQFGANCGKKEEDNKEKGKELSVTVTDSDEDDETVLEYMTRISPSPIDLERHVRQNLQRKMRSKVQTGEVSRLIDVPIADGCYSPEVIQAALALMKLSRDSWGSLEKDLHSSGEDDGRNKMDGTEDSGSSK